MSKDTKDWILRIKEGAEEELKGLYTLYEEEFKTWSGAMYSLSEAEAADVFQDAVITFYFNVKKGKLTTLTSTVKTYLFAIGKNLALKKIRKDNRLVVDNEVMEFNANVAYEELRVECSERQQLIAGCLQQLGDPCHSILRMFYFDRFSMDSIAQRLGYKNEHVVKSQKLRCLQRLRGMLEKKAVNNEDDV